MTYSRTVNWTKLPPSACLPSSITSASPDMCRVGTSDVFLSRIKNRKLQRLFTTGTLMINLAFNLCLFIFCFSGVKPKSSFLTDSHVAGKKLRACLELTTGQVLEFPLVKSKHDLRIFIPPVVEKKTVSEGCFFFSSAVLHFNVEAVHKNSCLTKCLWIFT